MAICRQIYELLRSTTTTKYDANDDYIIILTSQNLKNLQAVYPSPLVQVFIENMCAAYYSYSLLR
jgi:hypothetical protein